MTRQTTHAGFTIEIHPAKGPGSSHRFHVLDSSHIIQRLRFRTLRNAKQHCEGRRRHLEGR